MFFPLRNTSLPLSYQNGKPHALEINYFYATGGNLFILWYTFIICCIIFACSLFINLLTKIGLLAIYAEDVWWRFNYKILAIHRFMQLKKVSSVLVSCYKETLTNMKGLSVLLHRIKVRIIEIFQLSSVGDSENKLPFHDEESNSYSTCMDKDKATKTTSEGKHIVEKIHVSKLMKALSFFLNHCLLVPTPF